MTAASSAVTSGVTFTISPAGQMTRLPGLVHDELPIGVAKVPENPDGLGPARSGEHREVAAQPPPATPLPSRIA
jgi:hypothetical protein